jgi:hypothetical protein
MPIKLELSASVGFIHKESVTMHSHTVLKWLDLTTWRVIKVLMKGTVKTVNERNCKSFLDLSAH